MNVIKRWSEIEKLLEDNNGFCTVIELSDRLGVSLATIRRDLTEMEEQKVIKRIHGGAKLLPKEDFKRVGSVFSRIQDNYESKIIIGEFAAKLIKNNSFVFLDSSSTVSAMIPYITAENITVVTNSFYAAPQLVDAKITTILLPGRLQSNMQIASEETLGTLRHYYFDYAFPAQGRPPRSCGIRNRRRRRTVGCKRKSRAARPRNFDCPRRGQHVFRRKRPAAKPA